MYNLNGFDSPISATNSEEGFNFNTEDEEEEELLTDDVGDCSSYRDIKFESEEMKHLLKLETQPTKDKVVRPDYHAEHLFPQWILNNHEWQSTECRGKGNKISEILQTSYSVRSQEQTSSLIHWLMSVWKTAYTMGYKRCGQMSKVFQFLSYEPGQDIIIEGEKGLTFYIIISGDAIVLKEGIGQVAVLSKGHSFGELALTEGNDRRSATIRADTKVEILQLHKVDYDHFVKDIQFVERRENLHVLRSCALFAKWPRTKVQKMCNFCTRTTFEPGGVIFTQGDKPDKIYFIIEGQVNMFKEVYVVVRNQWPTGMKTSDGVSKKKVKPFLSKSLFKDDFFGELVQDEFRTATAKAKNRCTLLTLDRLEFTHLISGGKALEELKSGAGDASDDKKILDAMLRQLTIKGGPSTTAQLNDYVKVINSKAPKKKKRISSSIPSPTVTSVEHATDTCKTDDSSSSVSNAHSEQKSIGSSFLSPIKSRNPRTRRPRKSGGGGTETAESLPTISAASNTSTRTSTSGGHGDDDSDGDDIFARGLTVDENKATEFTYGSIPTLGKTKESKESAKASKHQEHLDRASNFERSLSRAASVVEDTFSDREMGTTTKPASVNGNRIKHLAQSMSEPVGSSSFDKPFNNLSQQLADKGNGKEGHLQIIVSEIVAAKKKSKYYDELAEVRFSAPVIVNHRAKKDTSTGHSLKFSGSKIKNNFSEPSKTVYAHTKNLKKSRRNPTIKISNDDNPVMTSIESVVLKSDKGRVVRSYLSNDINRYIDATNSKRNLPSCASPDTSTARVFKSKLMDEVSLYSSKDHARIAKRMVTPSSERVETPSKGELKESENL